MDQYEDMEEMIHIISTAIAKLESEKEFFHRSSQASSSEVSKALFLEIAEDFGDHLNRLEARKKKLEIALQDLKTARESKERPSPEIVRDPVCEMIVDPSKSKFVSTFKGKKYYFCSADCQKAFEIDPQKYLPS
jgi:YHS domain-containing protein